uniref:14-3-3 domain-containing protein n=1 Tax=Lactuca sativa TaxID=4236 RepID=A0A9R1XUJ0_LACSA|nr:hypothetical protein LSAT_V11C100010770 [Lactuca sativa]
MIKVAKLGVETDYGIKESTQLGIKIRKRNQEVMIKMQKISGEEYRHKWNHNSITQYHLNDIKKVMMRISFIHMVVLVMRCILLQDVMGLYSFCRKRDYYGYLVEFKFGNDKKDVADISLKLYEVATTTTKGELPPSFPIRLGHTLNLSVFCYKVMVQLFEP